MPDSKEPIPADPAGDVHPARRRWETPRVIVSKAEHTNKLVNTGETTVGALHFGPS